MFVAASAVIMMALSALYALYGKIPLVADIFFGIKAAVLVIVIDAMFARSALAFLAAAAMIATLRYRIGVPQVLTACAALGLIFIRI
jgi:chromate transporter